MGSGKNATCAWVLLLGMWLSPAVQAAPAAKAPAPPPPQTAVVLKHTPVDQTERGKELVLRATILASAGAYLPTLYYRPIGEARYYSLPMLPVPGSVNIYAGAIPGIFVTKDLEYYLESYDTQLRGPGQVGSQKGPLPVIVLDPAAVPSQVAVRSDPPDATLVIDDEEVGLTPWRGPLPPGQHELVLKKEGFLESASSLEVPPGRDLDLRLSLTPAAEAAQFAIMSDPAGATVYIDAQQLGNTPLIAPSPDGEHVVTLEKQGFARAERKVLFSKDRSIELSFSLQKLPPEPALAVTTDPAGASVYVDDTKTALGKTPFIGVIGAGEHSLILKMDGKRTAQAQIVMPEDRDLDLRFTLEDEKEAHPPIIAVSSDPTDASVFIDGTEVGKTPYINNLSPGEHKVKLVYPKFFPYEKTIKMPETNDMEVTLALIPEPPPPGPSKITIGAVPNDVEITVDGKVIGTVKGGVPVQLELPAGPHVANARREGFRSVEERFTVNQGEGLTMKLALQPIPKEAVDEPLLSIRSDPDGALVSIDGVQAGATPYSATLKGGKHKVVVSMEGFKSRDEAFELPPDKSFELRYSFTLVPVRKSVSLASAADQKKGKEDKGKEPIVNMEEVKSAGGPMSGAKFKVYKPGELAKIKAQREAEAARARAASAARARPAAPCTQQRCPPPLTSVGRAGPALVGLLGMGAALGAGYFAYASLQDAGNIKGALPLDEAFNNSRIDAEAIKTQGIIGIGLAGTAAVLGAVAAIWGSTASPMAKAEVAPAKKPEEPKAVEKKVEEKKPAEKKPVVEKKPDEPKAEEKKPDEPKPEEKKPDEPKPEEKKDGSGGDAPAWLGTVGFGVAPTSGGAQVGVYGTF